MALIATSLIENKEPNSLLMVSGHPFSASSQIKDKESNQCKSRRLWDSLSTKLASRPANCQIFGTINSSNKLLTAASLFLLFLTNYNNTSTIETTILIYSTPNNTRPEKQHTQRY